MIVQLEYTIVCMYLCMYTLMSGGPIGLLYVCMYVYVCMRTCVLRVTQAAVNASGVPCRRVVGNHAVGISCLHRQMYVCMNTMYVCMYVCMYFTYMYRSVFL